MKKLRAMVLLCVLCHESSGALVHYVQEARNDADNSTLAAVSSDQWLESGVSYSTVTAPSSWSTYRFTHWSNDRYAGETCRDAWGRALNPTSFVLLENTTATAHYLPATRDADGDGVPDWYEMEYYGSLTNNALSDADGDGLTLAQEYTGSTHPLYANTNQPGGVAWSDSALVACNLVRYPTYVLRSVPAGTVNQTAIVTNGTVISTPSLSGNATFGYWTLDGVRQQDAWGVAYPQVTFTVQTNNREAVAYLFSGDTDGDGVPDAYEQYYLGTLTNNATSDTDGDGITLAQEYSGGTHPLHANTHQPGGVSWADSSSITVNLAGYTRYVLRSIPAGAVDQSAIVPTNTVITSPSFSGNSTFGYWTLDGTQQRDAWGVACPQITFTVQGANREAVAYFFSGDTDGDGVPDAFEQYYFGALTHSASADADGDGFTLGQEYDNGTHPLYANASQSGGVSWSDSALILANLQSFPAATELLVDGTRMSFFSRAAATNTGCSFGGNTAPALGDWNGDGTVDLVVGAGSGALRIYDNAGSPVVPNLVERTPNFGPWSWAWTGTTNPAPALGDWSGDGRADLAVGGDTHTIVLVASSGSFSGAVVILTNTLTVAGGKAVPALADVTGDGYAELFVLLADGTVSLYTNSGNGLSSFRPSAARTNLLGTTVPQATGLSVVEARGASQVSVLVSDATGRIWQFRNNGAGGYSLVSKVFAGSYDGFAHRLTISASDFDGDGDVDILGGFAEGGLVYLRNPAMHLAISPPSVTVGAGDGAAFGVANARGAVSWSLARNASGGSIRADTGDYQSGLAGGMDCVEAVDDAGVRGRAYVNVIQPGEMTSFGKAVIVAGGRDLNDPVWLATDYLANKAYHVLRYKGYARETLRYLSFNPGRDIDGDGVANDIAGFTSLTNAAAAFTQWVGNAHRLVVYLVDHGSSSPESVYFRLNAGENLTATQLNAWLTALQDQYGTEVIVVMDFCYAGRFAQDLAYAGAARRVLVSATSPTELTYFLSGGYVSFSDLLLSGLLEGLDLQQAFALARDGVSAYQSPGLSDTGSSAVRIGATHLAGKDVPMIGSVAGNQTLTTNTTATLWVEGIQSYYPIASVSGTILPPSYAANTNTGVPVTEGAEVTLTPDGSGRYQASFDGFTEAGAYRVNYYARDIWGSVSPPKQGLVIQSGFDERLVLVAGGMTHSADWSVTANLAATAYQTALVRRLDKAHLQYLSPAVSQDLDGDGANDVNGASTLTGVAHAITNWAGSANKLMVYLVGAATHGQFQLSPTETLSGAQLNQWLNRFQQPGRSVMVVVEFDGSGGYVPALAATNGAERVVIASSKAGTPSVRAAGGLVSFSQFFLSGLFEGRSVGAAFSAARDAIRTASGRLKQMAQLDDSGNGLANEKNVDGLVAARRYLGAAFVTGEDTPYVGSVTPAATVVAGTPVLLWARDILDATGISNVWCVVTPPDYDGSGDLAQLSLSWNAENSRYEGIYTNFTQAGTYGCTYYARDNAGLLSSPKQSEVTATDQYEVDDAAGQATVFTVGDVEAHSLHSEVDEDWVRFYAPTGFFYNVEAKQLGTNSDVRLDLYYEQSDGGLAWVDSIDDYGFGADQTERLTLDLRTATSGMLPGIYYVRASSADTNLYGPGSAYELRVFIPGSGAGGVVLLTPGVNTNLFSIGGFYVYLGPGPALKAGAGWRIQGMTNQTWYTDPAIVYGLPASSNWVLTFREIPGFRAPTNRPLVIRADQTAGVLAYYLYTNLAPRAELPVLQGNGRVQLCFVAQAGRRYAVEHSTNLLQWTSCQTSTVPPDGLLTLILTNLTPTPNAFFRAKLVH